MSGKTSEDEPESVNVVEKLKATKQWRTLSAFQRKSDGQIMQRRRIFQLMMSCKALEDEPESVNVVEKLKATKQLRSHSAFQRKSDGQIMREKLLETESIPPIINLVRDEDWLEYMRKLGFPETRLQEMYTSSSSEKKIDMLHEWRNIAGHFLGTLSIILYEVTREISGSRDADVDRLFEGLSGHVMIRKGRDQAWFIYSLLDKYIDVDEWEKVVEKKLQMKATDVSEIEEKFPNNFREQKYQIFHFFCRSNGLDTLDAMIAGAGEKGLKFPSRFFYDRRGTLDFTIPRVQEKGLKVPPPYIFVNPVEVGDSQVGFRRRTIGTRVRCSSGNEGLSQHVDSLSVRSRESSNESGYFSASKSSSKLFDEITNDSSQAIVTRQTRNLSGIPSQTIWKVPHVKSRSLSVVEKLKATKPFRRHSSFQRTSDWQSLLGTPTDQRSMSGKTSEDEPDNAIRTLKYFDDMIDFVRDEDWLEYMRKLGFPETKLQEMYTARSFEKKIHMLGEWLNIADADLLDDTDLLDDNFWLQIFDKFRFLESCMHSGHLDRQLRVLQRNILRGHFTTALSNNLYRVAREISGSRDADVDRWFERMPHHVTITKGRDQAWFIYSLLEQYSDVDEWKEVVEKKLQIKATDVTEIEERFPNNFREQKYQIFHLFCQTNGLDTLDAGIAGIREKGLKVPPPFSSAERGFLLPVLHLHRFSPSSSLFNENATEMDLTEHGYSVSSADLFEKSAESIKDSDTITCARSIELDRKGVESADKKMLEQNYDPLFVDETAMVVGPNGAVLKVGGCKITIPEGALDVDAYICITSRYDRDAAENRATPLLKCKPHGLKFKKNVEVMLPTCYLTDGSVSVTAKARRSEDGESWETIKSFDYRIERCFKFSIRGFSWYDVILETLFNLAVEKLIVCCVPHKYSDDPKRLVIVCNIFDAVLEHKQQNCTDLFKKSIALGSGESCVSFQLRNKHLSIEPEEREVRDARATKMEQVSFLLKKQKTDLLFQSVKLIVKAGDGETENEFFIINCNSEMEEKPGPSAKLGSAPPDNRPKVTGQSISAAVVGCEKVNYAPNHHHHYYQREESAKQIAPPTREPIKNGRIDGQITGGALAGTSNDAHEVLHEPCSIAGLRDESSVPFVSKKDLSSQVSAKPIENGQNFPSSNTRDISACKSNGDHGRSSQDA